MAKNISCAAMGYECVFSLTADDDEQEFMLDTVEHHAAAKHSDLMDGETLKPAVKEKLRNLLSQSHYTAS